MEDAEDLRTVEEVAVAIAGFTSVVVAFGSRARGEWTRVEANRLWFLLAQALGALLLSFLPTLLRTAGLAEEVLWRLCDGVFAVFLATVGTRVILMEWGQRGLASQPWFVKATFPMGACVAIAQIFNVVGHAVVGVFLFSNR